MRLTTSGAGAVWYVKQFLGMPNPHAPARSPRETIIFSRAVAWRRSAGNPRFVSPPLPLTACSNRGRGGPWRRFADSPVSAIERGLPERKIVKRLAFLGADPAAKDAARILRML